MLNMREIVDYGPCYVVAINCPANGVSLPRKKVLFDVCDSATHETVYTFNTARQAKRFAHRYISDPEGAVQQRRQLSADRITHVRALWAVALLLNYMELNMLVSDKHRPYAPPERYVVRDMFPTENMIIARYYPDEESTSKEVLYISGIKAVRVISENIFTFETYSGKVYTISGTY